MGDLFCFLYKYYMKIQEAQQILNDNGFILENKHFDLWQYKLQVKKLLKPIQIKYGYKTFDAMRSYIQWESYVDIVTETMKDNFEQGKTPEQCVEQIKEILIDSVKHGG